MCYNDTTMEEKELKTSLKQRIIIGVIAFIMVGSMIASYAAIVINGGKSNDSGSSSKISDEVIAAYKAAYEEKLDAFKKGTKADYDRFMQYRSEAKAFNEESANSGDVQIKEIEVGTGQEITSEFTDYYAYYIGSCADESIFDSSLDDNDNPTAFSKALDASLGMIDGWNIGVTGMKLGGIRRITIPGSKAYGDQLEICGGYNKPLRFLVMVLPKEEPLKTLATEVDTAYMKLQYANNGIDYDSQMGE